METMDTVRTVYRINCKQNEIKQRARDVAVEQTVEFPVEAIHKPFILNEIIGKVMDISPAPGGGFLAEISYSTQATTHNVAQLFLVLFGNSSLHNDVSLEDIELPGPLLNDLRGPKHGIDGIRRLLGIDNRPLTCTALKPMGLDPKEIRDLLVTFARSGIDIIKDDHGLSDQPYCSFEARVTACARAIENVERETGNRSLYVPNINGTPDEMRKQVEIAGSLGIRAVMLAPMLMGLPFFWEFVQNEIPMAVLAHPTFSGALRINAATLFGKIFRYLGADGVIYVNYGGRFSYSRETCEEIAENLRDTNCPVKPAFPLPAGGMSYERIPELLEFYGPDTILLIGGSLYLAGDQISERCRRFVEQVHKHFSNHQDRLL